MSSIFYDSLLFAGYTNPPTAVTCNVKFSKDAYAYLWPVVKFRWKKPDFVAFEGSLNPGSYIIYAENGISEMGYAQDTLQYDFELAGIGDRETFEGRYEMFVRTNRADSAQGRHLGPPSRCEVNTFDRGKNIYYYIHIYLTVFIMDEKHACTLCA